QHQPRDGLAPGAVDDLVLVWRFELHVGVVRLDGLPTHALLNQLRLSLLRLVDVGARQGSGWVLTGREEIDLRPVGVAAPAEVAEDLEFSAWIYSASLGDVVLSQLLVDIEGPRRGIDADRNVLERVVTEDGRLDVVE